jgi:hypothetical protein
MSHRPWYSKLVILWKTILRTAATLRANRLSLLSPVFVLLLLLSLLLLVINTIAPLAPFVYSLF